ncbi:MAG: 16S rRNA (adenine(1518)-N(6)/adenine(1519)-N(6))-dimethyltransferase RsmA [Pseudomonadota bacterium]
MAALPPLREVIARHGLAARKALGQNFLLDLNLTARIAGAAGDLSQTHVMEVGAGPGGLTRALLSAGAKQVSGVERDPRCLEALQPLVDSSAGRLTLVEADALTIDPAAITGAPRAIVANLPYNIATPLLIRWLQDIESFSVMVLMFQKEVADRLLATPRSKSYGRLSVMTQWRADIGHVMTLPARAFTPPPKVASSVVRLTPRANPETATWAAMEAVTKAAFGQRRKMLRSSLRALGPAEALLASAGLNPTDRAEAIDVAGFAALARAFEAYKAD